MSDKLFQKKLFGGAAVLLAGGLAAGSLLAQPAPGSGRMGRMGRNIRAAMATLDLTDDQKTQVRAIFQAHKGEAQAFREQARTNRAALETAASAATPDPAAVGAAFLKVRSDRQAAVAKLKSVRTEIDTVLTPDQKARLDGWVAAHQQQRGMWRRQNLDE